MEIGKLLRMGLPVHVTGNTLMVRLRRDMVHPTWMNIIIGDQPLEYNWLPTNDHTHPTDIVIKVKGKEYVLPVSRIEFISK